MEKLGIIVRVSSRGIAIRHNNFSFSPKVVYKRPIRVIPHRHKVPELRDSIFSKNTYIYHPPKIYNISNIYESLKYVSYMDKRPIILNLKVNNIVSFERIGRMGMNGNMFKCNIRRR